MKILKTLVILYALAPTLGFSQTAFDFKGDAANPIFQKLGVNADKPMRLGWLVGTDKLITDINVPEISVYSSSNKVLTAKLVGPFAKADMDAIRTKSCVACDSTVGYFQYQLDGLVRLDGERVLVTSAFPDSKVGFEKIKMTNFLIKRAAELLGAKKTDPHKYLYLRSMDGKFTYSFHAFYDLKTRALKSYGILLYKRGVLLAKESKDFDPAQNCEGCPVPTFNDPLDEVYLPVNFVETSALPCPLVLVGTSSAEGRGLSLLTFDMDGVKSEIKATESVVNCCK